MKSLDAHLHEFKTEGYTIFPKILDDTWVQQMRDAFHEIVERIPTPDGSKPTHLVDLIEHKPKLTVPAITIPRILDFSELLIGPYVQLESITYRCIRRCPKQRPKNAPPVTIATCSHSSLKMTSITARCFSTPSSTFKT